MNLSYIIDTIGNLNIKTVFISEEDEHEYEDEAFECCRGSCCDHYDEEKGGFCDWWGATDSNCPNTPWKCFFEEKEGKEVKDLKEGRPPDGTFEWYVFLFFVFLFILSFYKEIITSLIFCWSWTKNKTKKHVPRLWKKTKYDLWVWKHRRFIIPKKKRKLKRKIKKLTKLDYTK